MKDAPLDIPVSCFPIYELPQYEFSVESGSTGNPWAKIASDCITYSLLHLHWEGHFDIDLVSKAKHILWGRLRWKGPKYVLSLKEDYIREDNLPWLESKIIESFYNDSGEEFFCLNVFANILVDNILYEPVEFNNPPKQVISKVVIHSNANLWTFDVQMDYQYGTSIPIAQKLKIRLPKHNRDVIRRAKENFARKFQKELESKDTQALLKAISKQVWWNLRRRSPSD